jgi:hypothetical protein
LGGTISVQFGLAAAACVGESFGSTTITLRPITTTKTVIPIPMSINGENFGRRLRPRIDESGVALLRGLVSIFLLNLFHCCSFMPFLVKKKKVF